MYVGRRDPLMSILVRKSFCSEWHDSQGELWVEVKVPLIGKEFSFAHYYSFMIKPEQVYDSSDIYNEVFVNASAYIKVVERFIVDNKRVNQDTMHLWSEELVSLFISYELSKFYNNVHYRVWLNAQDYLITLYQVFKQSGYTAQGFIEHYGDEHIKVLFQK